MKRAKAMGARTAMKSKLGPVSAAADERGAVYTVEYWSVFMCAGAGEPDSNSRLLVTKE